MKKEEEEKVGKVEVIETNDKSKTLIKKLFADVKNAEARLKIALESMATALDLPKGTVLNDETFNFEIRE